jgi:UDP-N-acetylmuramate dehydrogenase
MNIPGLQENVSLARYTTFKIGGPARYFLIATTTEQMVSAVQEANAAGVKWMVLGGGSDILVADKGYDGLVIKTELRDIDIDADSGQVRAGSGMLINAFIQQSAKRGLAGMEFAIGVPATIGGAVWANLGARGSETAEYMIETTVLDASGKKQVLTNEECAFAYRDSIFKTEDYVILDALFQLKKGDPSDIRARILELSKKRKAQQDIGMQCAGCIFQNPTDQTDIAAAQLIDELGLKGKQIGGAKVSDVHANFIINTGDATADDVVQLISYIKQQVRDKKGVQLMEEVEYIGFE